MATQKIWGYDEARENFYRPYDNLRKMHPAFSGMSIEQLQNVHNTPGLEGLFGSGEGGGGPVSPVGVGHRTWREVMLGGLPPGLAMQAQNWTDAQLESYTRQNGLLGGKEESFGEILKEGAGIVTPFALSMLGANYLSGLGGAGELAGGAMDMGGLGAGEAMGLGGGYTSPALGATAAEGLYTFPGEAAVGNAAYPAGTATSSGVGGGLWSGIKGAASSIKDVGGLGGLKNLFAPVDEGMNDLFGNDWGAKAAGSIPILAAMDYAKSQSPFDTSRLESTYNQFDPSALAYEYDQNTARGRDSLTSGLQSRGVMGSSFGNNDITNFQTSRDLGRRSLVNQGLAARGGLASSILDAQVKERALKNDLYGRSLMALGNVLGGRR
jgi:hypothetical protein